MSPGPTVLRSKVLADKGLVNRPFQSSLVISLGRSLHAGYLGLRQSNSNSKSWPGHEKSTSA